MKKGKIWILFSSISTLSLLLVPFINNDLTASSFVSICLSSFGTWATILSFYWAYLELFSDAKKMRNKMNEVSLYNLKRIKNYSKGLYVKPGIEEDILLLIQHVLPKEFESYYDELLVYRNNIDIYINSLNLKIDGIHRFLRPFLNNERKLFEYFPFFTYELIEIFDSIILLTKELQKAFLRHDVNEINIILEKLKPILDILASLGADEANKRIAKINSLLNERNNTSDFIFDPLGIKKDAIGDIELKIIMKKIFDLLDELDWLEGFTDPRSRLEGEYFLDSLVKVRRMYLKGKKGTGKSHFLANICHSLKDNVPFVFLRGVDFDENPILEIQILSQLGLTSLNFPRFIKNLIELGENVQRPILFIIDGINESKSPHTWKNLNNIISEMKSPWIIPIISSRPFYSKILKDYIPNILYEHLMDIQISRDALIERYQDYYKIQIVDKLELPNIFTPLDLKLLSEFAKEKGLVSIEITNKSLNQALINQFEVLNRDYALCNHLDPGIQWISRTIDQIVELILDNKSPRINREEIYNRTESGLDWTRSVLYYLISNEIVLQNDMYIEFSSQYFQDYSIGKHLFDNPLRDQKIVELIVFKLPWIEESLKEFILLGGEFLTNIVERNRNQIENHDYQNLFLHAAKIDIDSIFCLEEVTTNQQDFLYKLFTECEIYQKSIIERLDLIKFNKNHSLNSLFLDKILSAITMRKRDLTFGENIRKSYYIELTNGMDKQKIHFQALKTIENIKYPSTAHEANVVLTGLKWYLSSNCRHIRDFVTLKLVEIGENFFPTLYDIVQDSIELDDLYIIERLFAALFGVISRVEIESAYLRYLKDLINDKILIAGKFEHLLIRDYASQILHLINPSKKPIKCFTNVSDEIIYDKACYENIRNRDPFWGLMDRTIKMDFAKYVLARISKRFQRAELPDLKKTICQVRKRINELGFDYSLYEKIDQDISEQNWRTKFKIERWSKKYSWIAFHELAAKRFGKFPNILPYDEIRYQRDIEPTFPEYRINKTNYQFFSHIGADWSIICNDPVFIGKNNFLNSNSEWIILDMNYMNHKHGLMLSFETNSIIHFKDDPNSNRKDYFLDFWNKEIYDVFLTEDPSSYLDDSDNSIRLTWHYNWEGHQNQLNKNIIIPQPVPKLVRDLKLLRVRGSFDWKDENGHTAIKCRAISSNGDILGKVFMIREDLLREYLKKANSIIYIYSITDKDEPGKFIVSHYQWGYLDENFCYHKLLCRHNPKSFSSHL